VGWGGWPARQSPHPPTDSGLEWSHVGTQPPCPAIAPQSTYIGESRTACGWGRGRIPGTHLGGVVGGVGWLAWTPESPPAHRLRAGVVTCWYATSLSRPRSAVYIHRRVVGGVRVGSGTHDGYTPWWGRGCVGSTVHTAIRRLRLPAPDSGVVPLWCRHHPDHADAP